MRRTRPTSEKKWGALAAGSPVISSAMHFSPVISSPTSVPWYRLPCTSVPWYRLLLHSHDIFYFNPWNTYFFTEMVWFMFWRCWAIKHSLSTSTCFQKTWMFGFFQKVHSKLQCFESRYKARLRWFRSKLQFGSLPAVLYNQLQLTKLNYCTWWF